MLPVPVPVVTDNAIAGPSTPVVSKRTRASGKREMKNTLTALDEPVVVDDEDNLPKRKKARNVAGSKPVQ